MTSAVRVCCTVSGDISFKVLREVRDLDDNDTYFVDARCVAVHEKGSVVDIKWFRDGKPQDPSPFVSLISLFYIY